MIVLGTCDNCTPCGDVQCDKIVILIGNGLEPANNLSFLTYGEGNPVQITVARLAKHEYGYHGTPADFEAEQGYPPPVADGSFYLDWDTGSYWLNTGGVFAIDTPPDHGNGTISVDFEVQLTECGCPHMWTNETVTVSWADGDTANKTLTLTSPAHTGAVPYWSCEGNPFLGENAELAIVSSTAGTGACVELGYGVTLIAVCGHSVTNSGWGTNEPYQIRIWSAIDTKTVGREDYDGATDPTYLREDSSYDYDDPGSVDASGWREYFAHGGGVKELHLFSDSSSEATLFRTTNSGMTSPTERTFNDGTGTLTSELSVSGASIPRPTTDVFALLAEAKAASASGGEGYGWSAPVLEYVFKIRANNANYDFSAPGFDPSKTYAYTGSDLPVQPFDPADWTEVADTGFAFEYVATTAQAKEFEAYPIDDPGIAFLARHVYQPEGYYARCSTIDATRSASGSPYPYKVEVRFRTWEDETLVDTSSWIDITDTVYDVDAPTTLGGASVIKYITSEIVVTPLAGATCDPTASPVFVCHPGLSC